MLSHFHYEEIEKCSEANIKQHADDLLQGLKAMKEEINDSVNNLIAI